MFRCFSTLKGAALLAGVSLFAAYLVFWHGTHVAAALPVLLILACPLMHVFMHGGHGHRHGSMQHGNDGAEGGDHPAEAAAIRSLNFPAAPPKIGDNGTETMSGVADGAKRDSDGISRMEKDHGTASDMAKHDTVPPGMVGLVYTCPMHSQVRSPAPGLCPICNMTLVPEAKSGAA